MEVVVTSKGVVVKVEVVSIVDDIVLAKVFRDRGLRNESVLDLREASIKLVVSFGGISNVIHSSGDGR